MSTRTSNIPRIQSLDDFRTYMWEECDEHFPEDSSLADYIKHWLWSGRGVDNCFGSFEIFLKVIPLIVDEWYRDPTLIHFGGSEKPAIEPFERQATTAFGGDEHLHAIFDRDNFTTAVYIRLHIQQAR